MTAYAEIRRDGWIVSKPWMIDLYVDGELWKSWSGPFRTKKSALKHCDCVGVPIGNPNVIGISSNGMVFLDPNKA